MKWRGRIRLTTTVKTVKDVKAFEAALREIAQNFKRFSINWQSQAWGAPLAIR